MKITRETGLGRFGVSIHNDTALGIYGSQRNLVVETPMQFRGGRLDIGHIGAFTYLGNTNSFIRHVGRIGRFCAIAPDMQAGHVEHSVSMLSPHPMFVSEFDPTWTAARGLYEKEDTIREIGTANYESIKRKAHIEIGNDVWIGQGVLISRGVKIGDGAIVAARSVIVNDVEPYTIVGGVPAKTIRKRFEPEIIERLLQAKWWEYGPEILKGVRIDLIEDAVNEIEKRISDGLPKYTPDRMEFNIAAKRITLITAATEQRRLIRQY